MPGRDELSSGMSLLHSAVIPDRRVADVLEWIQERNVASHLSVRQIPFSALDQWSFDADTDHLVHRSGKFFRISGLRVRTSFGPRREWDQPIILQPEIGILGILTKRIAGISRFLMQAKAEPGNINGVQVSPTVQATRSNYTQVHRGRRPEFLEYFIDKNRGRVLVDQLQPEQGSRFLRKQNRNMLVEIDEDVSATDDFRWLTLAQIKALLALDDVVNMDARTVLACVPYADAGLKEYCGNLPLELGSTVEFMGHRIEGFEKDLLISMLPRRGVLHSLDALLGWYADMRCSYDLATEIVPLGSVRNWFRSEDEIRHDTGRYFSVIAVAAEAGTREVVSWTQPILKHFGVGLAGFLTQKIGGVLHFLVGASVEPGSFDVVDLGPSVACAGVEGRREMTPPFYDRFVSASPSEVRYDAVQSEEGGRFFHFRNRYMVVELAQDEALALPANYIWMTLGQILELTRFGYFNIEARNLVACLGAR